MAIGENLKTAFSDKSKVRTLIIVFVIVVLALLYVFFFQKTPTVQNSQLNIGGVTDTVQGQKTVDPKMKQVIQTADQNRVVEAEKTGGSAMPTPVLTNDKDPIDTILSTPDKAAPPVIEKPIVSLPIKEDNSPIITQPINKSVSSPVMYNQVPPNAEDVKDQVDKMKLILNKNYAVAEVVSMYTKPENTSATDVQSSATGATNSAADSTVKSKIKLPLAGTILYGQMVGRANSDAPGPVLATLLQGPYKGATLIGSFSKQRESLIITFTKMTVLKDSEGNDINETQAINAVAVDTTYIGTALATDVDRHLFEKIAYGFASTFASSFGQALSSNNSSITTSGSTTVVETTKNTMKDAAEQATASSIGTVGKTLYDIYGNRDTTIIVEAGTPVGILFLGSANGSTN